MFRPCGVSCSGRSVPDARAGAGTGMADVLRRTDCAVDAGGAAARSGRTGGGLARRPLGRGQTDGRLSRRHRARLRGLRVFERSDHADRGPCRDGPVRGNIPSRRYRLGGQTCDPTRQIDRVSGDLRINRGGVCLADRSAAGGSIRLARRLHRSRSRDACAGRFACGDDCTRTCQGTQDRCRGGGSRADTARRSPCVHRACRDHVDDNDRLLRDHDIAAEMVRAASGFGIGRG